MSPRDVCGGIDVGGTKISSALFDAEGALLDKEKLSLHKAGGDLAADQIAAEILRLEARARDGGGELVAVGVSVPGIVYSESGEVWAPNIRGWDRFPLRERLLSKVPAVFGPGPGSEGRPDEEPARTAAEAFRLVIESDRSAYVSGEAWRGAAAGAKNAVFLAVGTGIGAGILCGGRLVHGAEDIAGAVGWFGLDREFKPSYAMMGCFEAEASGNSVGRKARELVRSGRKSMMKDLAGGDLERITAETVAAAARRKDAAALEVVGEAAGWLAMGVANIVSILNPEAVILGGGLFQAPDVFLEPVRLGFRKWAQPLAAKNVRIEASALGEDAGLFGCGKLAWDSLNGKKE